MDNAVSSSSGIPPDTWLATGCVLIGIWVLVSTLPSFMESVVLTWPAVHVAGSVFFGVRLLLGAWLVLGASGLRRLVRWTQYAGIRRSAELDHGE